MKRFSEITVLVCEWVFIAGGILLSLKVLGILILSGATWWIALPENNRSILLPIVPVVGAALVASIALLGVILTVQVGKSNVRLQLSHDSHERERERQMDLRRDVFLEASVSIYSLLGLIGRMADLEKPLSDLVDEFQEVASKAAKLHVVANIVTIHALLDFMSVLGPLWMDLSVRRARTQITDSKMKAHGSQRDVALEGHREMNEAMRRFNLDLRTDQPKFDAMVAQAALYKDRYDKWAASHDALSRKRLESTIEVNRGFAEKQAELFDKVCTLVVAMRRDLELPVDESAYTAAVVEQAKLAKRSLERLHEQIKELASGTDS